LAQRDGHACRARPAGSDAPPVFDTELLARLAEASESDSGRLLPLLCDLATDRGWTEQRLRQWGYRPDLTTKSFGQDSMREPPRALIELWAHGALGWTVERGSEVHSAAVAMLGDEAQVQHRVWRGQVHALLPLIDTQRRLMCEYLMNHHGTAWQSWVEASPQEEEDERSPGLGRLSCLF
jgi:hypothetical protein